MALTAIKAFQDRRVRKVFKAQPVQPVLLALTVPQVFKANPEPPVRMAMTVKQGQQDLRVRLALPAPQAQAVQRERLVRRGR